MTDDTRRLVLVDGSSYLYRAFHAMPDLRADRNDRDSLPTGAIRGMVNMMQALQKAHPSAYAACVFDASGPTFRDDLYAEYKANRSAMPDDLRRQIEPIHQVVRLLGWPVLAVPGVEADDVIGTLAAHAAAQGLEVIISSGDKDLSQLVTEQVVVIDSMNGKRRDVAGVQAEFGVPPARMVDFQTLVGDSVDNVPGVPKVGPKTAAKWLAEFGSLDALVAEASQVPGAAGNNLRASLDWLPTARALVTIKTDCELAGDLPGWPALDGLKRQALQHDALQAFYQAHGFRSLAAGKGEADGGAGTPPNDAAAPSPAAPQSALQGEPRYQTIDTPEALAQLLATLQQAELVALDTETTHLDPMRATLVGISVAWAVGQAAYIPLAHAYPGVPDQLGVEPVLDALRPWLESPNHAKLGQHLKYDQHVLQNHGVMLRGVAHDTMLQSYVLEVHQPHSLESLARRHVGREGLSYEDLCGKGAQQIGIDQVDIARVAQYACEDADYCLDVHHVLWPKLQAEPALRDIYALELASAQVLQRIERHGVCIDATTLHAQSQALGERMVALEAKAHELAGAPFNLASPKQIGDIFFNQLGLPVIKKTAKGAPSTDEEVLEKLAEDYPLPATILEHRGLAKLKSTYTDKLPAMALPRTGRVHTHYAQAVAVTGRLSSNEPNLQNIPIRTAEGRRVREAFVAPAGALLASADYSQIELRIMAHLSQDQALIDAFAQGLDIHRATAAEIFSVPPDDVTTEQRRYAKTINFGLIYGMSAFGLARNLGIDNVSAKNYIERYFQRYPGVRRYMDTTREQAREQGYVQTVFGRRLYLPEIRSPNGPRRAGAERAAINAPMQGTAADLIKRAMVAVQRALDAECPEVAMVMQVHDELVFELPETRRDWVQQRVPQLMAQVAELRVPLLAEVGFGHNWEQAH
jgi:DNA polymerase-1